MTAIKIAVIVIVSYFIGNVNFAVILSALKHGDIRKSGSGNPGTMNIVRTYGKALGALCLVLDGLKAAVPAFFAWWWMSGVPYAVDDKLGLYISALSTVVGHIYPITMKFKGGKGIACIIGIFVLCQPIVTLIAFAIGLAYIIIFKIGAIGSFIMILTPSIYELCILGTSDWISSLLILIMLALAFWAHRSNIYRIFTGTENRTVLFPNKKN